MKYSLLTKLLVLAGAVLASLSVSAFISLLVGGAVFISRKLDTDKYAWTFTAMLWGLIGGFLATGLVFVYSLIAVPSVTVVFLFGFTGIVALFPTWQATDQIKGFPLGWKRTLIKYCAATFLAYFLGFYLAFYLLTIISPTSANLAFRPMLFERMIPWLPYLLCAAITFCGSLPYIFGKLHQMYDDTNFANRVLRLTR